MRWDQLNENHTHIHSWRNNNNNPNISDLKPVSVLYHPEYDAQVVGEACQLSAFW